MTRRTVAPLTAEERARAFVFEATRIVDRLRARQEEPDDAAPITLEVLIGAGFTVAADGQRLSAGRDAELERLAAYLCRAAIAELPLETQRKLMARMADFHSDVEPDLAEAPSFFAVRTAFSGASWSLKVSAHALGSSAVVAAADGVVEDRTERAAA